ncbi:hypothetical protein K431DRAFT_76749 [Polychaeton citri CBS 116435]|uniref:Uncharacterized protein n=1 Tax=Polychaeton citri CBS 116435 TaxID=1314669 RepID=A0A9P4UNW3_9PEZI|nr:hypothetical protein K431DRAFT_76749 [Polychaeton citri CBS 116435]
MARTQLAVNPSLIRSEPRLPSPILYFDCIRLQCLGEALPESYVQHVDQRNLKHKYSGNDCHQRTWPQRMCPLAACREDFAVITTCNEGYPHLSGSCDLEFISRFRHGHPITAQAHVRPLPCEMARPTIRRQSCRQIQAIWRSNSTLICAFRPRRSSCRCSLTGRRETLSSSICHRCPVMLSFAICLTQQQTYPSFGSKACRLSHLARDLRR